MPLLPSPAGLLIYNLEIFKKKTPPFSYKVEYLKFRVEMRGSSEVLSDFGCFLEEISLPKLLKLNPRIKETPEPELVVNMSSYPLQTTGFYRQASTITQMMAITWSSLQP